MKYFDNNNGCLTNVVIALNLVSLVSLNTVLDDLAVIRKQSLGDAKIRNPLKASLGRLSVALA